MQFEKDINCDTLFHTSLEILNTWMKYPFRLKSFTKQATPVTLTFHAKG